MPLGSRSVSKHHTVFTRILLSAALLVLLAAVAATPRIAGLVLAADGTLDNPATIAELQHVRLALVALGILLLTTRSWLVTLLTRHPNVVALGLGCTFSLGLFACAELFLALRSSHTEPATILHASDGREPAIVPDPVLGYKPLPSSQIRAKRILGGRTLFEATYTQNAEARRIVPPVASAAPLDGSARVALFFGCSFTYGEGVQDDQTLPFFYSVDRGNTRAINLGYNGYGPQNMLALLDDTAALASLRTEIGTAPAVETIYTFIDHHVKRSSGALSVMHYGKDLPAYELDTQGDVARVGTFASRRPLVTPLLRALSLSRVLSAMHVDWPLSVSHDDLALTVALIAKSRDRLAAAFPGNGFHVLLYPGTRLADRLIPLLRGKNLDVLDYTRAAFGWNPETMAIPVDLHPNERGHAYVARRLADDLARGDASHAPVAETTH